MVDRMLGGKPKTTESDELIRVNIRKMAEGEALHCADPLISVLVRLIDWKKPQVSLVCNQCKKVSGLEFECKCASLARGFGSDPHRFGSGSFGSTSISAYRFCSGCRATHKSGRYTCVDCNCDIKTS